MAAGRVRESCCGRSQTDAQQLGGMGAIAGGGMQGNFQQRSSPASRKKAPAEPARVARERRTRMCNCKARLPISSTIAQGDGPANGVGQFANVARPVVGAQGGAKGGAQVRAARPGAANFAAKYSASSIMSSPRSRNGGRVSGITFSR